MEYLNTPVSMGVTGQFLFACESGNLTALKNTMAKMKNEGIWDVNYRNVEGFTGLHLALFARCQDKNQSRLDDYTEVINFLLEEKPKLDDLHLHYLNENGTLAVLETPF